MESPGILCPSGSKPVVTGQTMPAHQCLRTAGSPNLPSEVSIHLEHVIYFQLDNQAAVWCIEHQGSFWLEIILSVLEDLLDLAHSHQLCLTFQYSTSWVVRMFGWIFCPSLLSSQFNCPDINLFAILDLHLVPLFLTWFSQTEVGGPDTFMVDLNR